MDTRFEKYIKLLHADRATDEELQKAEDELHKTFATLSQEEQKVANIFLHDIQSGDFEITPGKSLHDYITEYLSKEEEEQINKIVSALGLDEKALREMLALKITDKNINEFGRFDALKSTVDKEKAKKYFEALSGKKVPVPMVNIRVDKMLREFIVKGGCEVDVPKTL